MGVGNFHLAYSRQHKKSLRQRKYAKIPAIEVGWGLGHAAGIKTLFIFPNTFCRLKCLPLPPANANPYPNGYGHGDCWVLANGLTTLTFNKDFK